MPNPNINRRAPGVTGSSGAGISAAAQAALDDWVSRVQGQGSNVTGAGTQTAVGRYIDGLMKDGVWNRLVRHSIYAGDGLLAVNAPLKNGGPFATDTNHNFVSGDYSQSAGLTGNGTTKFLEIGLACNDGAMGDNDIHNACYSRTNDNTGILIGATNGVPSTTELAASFGGNSVWDSNDYVTQRALAVDAGGIGMYIGSRISSASSTLYKDGVSIATNGNAGGARVSLYFYVHASNQSIAAVNFTARTIEMYSVGTGLTATDAANFTARYAALRTALGR